MSAKLNQLITGLIQREGGYSNDPTDAGGETNWGITIKTARRNGYLGPMKDMPREVAANIYRLEFWINPGWADLAAIDHANAGLQLVAEELLDTGVNMGPGTAGKFLQRSLNVLNRQGADWPDLVVDGEAGRATREAVKGLMKARPVDGLAVLNRMLNSLQSVRYIEIAEANPSQERFQFGWQLNRVV